MPPSAGAIATPTVRNERAFLITVVGVTSVVAVAAGQLPGDWVWLSPPPPPFFPLLPSAPALNLAMETKI